MTQHLTKCPKCGCDRFRVYEDYWWDASVDTETGVLGCTSAESQIAFILCVACDEELTQSQFKEIEFN